MEEMKGNPLQCYKRGEDIVPDKYHVILPELPVAQDCSCPTAPLSGSTRGHLSKQQSSSSSSTCQPGHTVWSCSLEKQGGQLHHQGMRRTEQASAEDQPRERARGGKGNVEMNCRVKEGNSREKGKMSEKNLGKEKNTGKHSTRERLKENGKTVPNCILLYFPELPLPL